MTGPIGNEPLPDRQEPPREGVPDAIQTPHRLDPASHRHGLVRWDLVDHIHVLGFACIFVVRKSRHVTTLKTQENFCRSFDGIAPQGGMRGRSSLAACFWAPCRLMKSSGPRLDGGEPDHGRNERFVNPTARTL